MLRMSRENLDSSITKVLAKTSFGMKDKSLRTVLSASPTQQPYLLDEYDNTIIVTPKKLKDKIVLATLSWYFSEEVGILIRLSLEEHWGAELQEVGTVVLTSKEFCLTWLQIQEDFNEYDFFGNYFSEKQVDRVLQQLDFAKKSHRKVKRYTGYCRGYRESSRQGPRPLPPELLPWTKEKEEEDLRQIVRQVKTILLVEKIEAKLRSTS